MPGKRAFAASTTPIATTHRTTRPREDSRKTAAASRAIAGTAITTAPRRSQYAIQIIRATARYAPYSAAEVIVPNDRITPSTFNEPTAPLLTHCSSHDVNPTRVCA